MTPDSTRRTIRVLHVFKTYFPESQGGIQEAVRQICATTRELGVESTVFTVTRGNKALELELPEAHVFAYPLDFEVASCPVSWRAFAAFRRHLAAADLVHYHFPWPYADVLDLRRHGSPPAVITYHSDIVRQQRLLSVYLPLMHAFLARAARIVVTSPQYGQSSPHLQRYHRKVEVIPLGLGERTYPPVDPQRCNEWEHKLGPGFFLFVGVLRYYKGLHTLIEAMRGAPYRLAIVGQGPMDAQLRAQAQCADNLTFLGALSDADKVALLSLARAVVLPSHLRSEAFGISLLEGAMYGKPLVSCEIGTGTTYINVDGETGLVTPPENPPALRAALDRLHTDPAMAEALGRGARRRFEALFTAERMGRRYRELYDRVLCEHAERTGGTG